MEAIYDSSQVEKVNPMKLLKILLDLAELMPLYHIYILIVTRENNRTRYEYIGRHNATEWSIRSMPNRTFSKSQINKFFLSKMPFLRSIALERNTERNDEIGFTYLYDCSENCFAHKIHAANSILRGYYIDMPLKRQAKRNTVNQELRFLPPSRQGNFPGGIEYQEALQRYSVNEKPRSRSRSIK